MGAVQVPAEWRWENTYYDRLTITIPINDIIDHKPDHTCICVPEIIPITDTESGVTAYLVSHHAFDGRHEEHWRRES